MKKQEARCALHDCPRRACAGQHSTKKQVAEAMWKKIDDLAAGILKQLEDVFCLKLVELKDDLLKVRDYFHQPQHRNVAGCETWDAFCQEKLHRTKQGVNKMLREGGNKVSGGREGKDGKLSEAAQIVKDETAATDRILAWLNHFKSTSERLEKLRAFVKLLEAAIEKEAAKEGEETNGGK